MENPELIISAPGKVLVTGGYLVLERPHSGLVLATSAKFYTTISKLPTAAPGVVCVESPQFQNSFSYKVSASDASISFLGDYQGPSGMAPCSSKNPYIEYSVMSAVFASIGLTSAKNVDDKLSSGLVVQIFADNDFYSQRDQLQSRGLPITGDSLRALPKFLPLFPASPAASDDSSDRPAHKAEIAKTGLGSSAALVTSLVSALLHYLGAISLPNAETAATSDGTVRDCEIAHRVSQFAHCAAQGKIGSGFDVSSATYGSQKYVRFSPALLKALLDIMDTRYPTPEEIVSNLQINTPSLDCAEQPSWDHEHQKFSLPAGFELVLADVAGGSSTPSMVSSVLKWKKERAEEANALWSTLSATNDSVEARFRTLHSLRAQDETAFAEALKQLSVLPADEWRQVDSPVAECLCQLREEFLQVRGMLKRMGDEAHVPIEPDAQSALVDLTMAVPGVLIAGVPGAGGFDAIFAVTLGAGPRKQVEERWASFKESSVCALLLTESAGGNGAVVESASVLGSTVTTTTTNDSVEAIQVPLPSIAAPAPSISAASKCPVVRLSKIVGGVVLVGALGFFIAKKARILK